MKVHIAFDIEKACKISWQNAFPPTTKCCYCGANSRLGFTVDEFDNNPGDKFLCHLYKNTTEKKWLHDSVAVAVYFCEKCLEPTALANQA